jgi:predicted small metal-binding protein
MEDEMKRFACGDVVPGCESVFVSTSEDDILAQVARHAAQDHGMSSVPPEVADQVLARIVAA